MADRQRKPTWVQQLVVGADVLETRLAVARARELQPDGQAVANGVAELIGKAREAALQQPGLLARQWSWWSGSSIEAGHRNLHAARAQMVELYDEPDLQAEIPGAVARAQSTLPLGDPRLLAAATLQAMPVAPRRARLRRLIEDGYEAVDQRYGRLRSLRNIVLLAALCITLLVSATLLVVSLNPNVMPLCFGDAGASGTGGGGGLTCPSAADARTPQRGDVLIVALLGLLGGALAAAVSVRNLNGTTTAYDVPVALALLKVPLGAFTAIVGLVAIQGDFVPGLSTLDSQPQILAYAFVLGFAQQVFTRLLDRRAETLMAGLPGQDTATRPPPPTAAPSATPADATAPAPAEADPEVLAQGAALVEEEDPELSVAEDTPPTYLPNPEGDEEGQVQDDEQEDLLPDAPEQDDR